MDLIKEHELEPRFERWPGCARGIAHAFPRPKKIQRLQR
jgi:hypothetical protein